MSLFKAIKDDLKGDVETVKELATGKYKSKYTKKDWIEGVKEAFKDPMTYIFFILIIAAFLSGIMYSGKYWQDKANSFAIDFCMEENPEFGESYILDNFNNHSLEQVENENKIDTFVFEHS